MNPSDQSKLNSPKLIVHEQSSAETLAAAQYENVSVRVYVFK